MNRAEDGTRTRDPNLGKVMLYQLSYFRMVCFSFAIAKVEQISELPNFLSEFLPVFLGSFHPILIINVYRVVNSLCLIQFQLETPL